MKRPVGIGTELAAERPYSSNGARPTIAAKAQRRSASPADSRARSQVDVPGCQKRRPALTSERSILFLVDQLCELGGGERTALQLARSLSEYGFRVFVVTLRDHPDPNAYRLYKHIIIMPLSSCFGWQAVRTGLRLKSLIRLEKISIVQTFFESADTYGAVVARLSGVRCIVSSRRDMGILRNQKHRVAYRLLARLYSAVLAVSDQVGAWHRQEDRLNSAQVHTIYNGLALERFSMLRPEADVRQMFGLPARSPLVTTIANVNRWKGLDVFLNAAAIVHEQHPDAIFVVAGDWTDLPLVDELRAQASSLGIANQVYFLGRIADVAPLLLTSDVFALLSRSEGFPNVVLEAMASRLPVVATRVGGTPEAVQEGLTGFLVPAEDSSAAGKRISDLLTDGVLRKRMGAAGRACVEECFSLEQMMKRHMEVYDALTPQR